MILGQDTSINMDAVKRALVALRERTETSFYVHDLRERTSANRFDQARPVLASGGRVALLDIQRSIDINDGDIVAVRTSDGRTLNYFVFDVERSRFSRSKYTMHAVLWTLPVGGFGPCGRNRFDDLSDMRELRLEDAPLRRAV